MKINAAQLEAFFTISKALNFTKAAEELHVTQSALSQRIAKLEGELETTLLIRDRSALRLTEAGEQLLRLCQINSQAETEFLSRLKDTKDELAGVLRIGGFSSVNRSLVIPALKEILGANQRLSLQLITKELRELPQLLKTAEVDYIFTNEPEVTEEVEGVFLGFEDNVLVRSKSYQDTEVFLDHDETDITTKLYFSANKVRFKPKSMRYLDDVYGLLDGVRNGLGKAVLPLHIISRERDLEVIDSHMRLSVPVYLKFYRQSYYRRVHSIFIDSIRAHFTANLRQPR